MRAIGAAGLWAVLTVSAIGAARAQSIPVDVRVDARNRLDSLLHAYGKTVGMRFFRNRDDPFEIDGFYDKDLRYSSRFELEVNITPENTIGIRVYPQFYGRRINVDEVRDPNRLALELLHLSAHNFLHWGVDDASHVFAAYAFTLESGFPEEAIKEVLRSREMVQFIE